MRPRIISHGWLAALFLICSQSSLAQGSELDALLLENSNLMQEGRIDEALILLEGAENKYSDSREFMNNLAVAYLGNSQPEEALVIFRTLVDSDPMYSIIAHNLLEMELQISESRPERINPQLFIQSVDTYFDGGQVQSSTENDAGQAASAAIRETAQSLGEVWASRWSDNDFIGYLSMYSRDFIGPNGENISQWARARRAPLSKPGNIYVQVGNFNTTMINDDVQISFDQNYNSSNYSDRVRKQLVLTAEEDGWKIIKEVTLETY